ncbi:MAG: amino acid ABC transporter permease [Eubacterium sp.]|nr:amino acid ABC transporter permease [Eubacterium sp.]
MWWEELKLQLYQTFVQDGNYMYFVRGIGITLLVTVLALVMGIVIGLAVAIVRSGYDLRSDGKKNHLLGFFNIICKIYLTVIRGTPTMVQLLIMWFVIWAGARSTNGNLIRCAVLTFGINSGAYVAEIFRSGIMSIDKGQMEAGRSLGLPYAASLFSIVIPQAFKNVLPALGNEMITLLKETSIVTVIGLKDLTKGAMIIQAKNYQALVPFIAIALIYLGIVMIMVKILSVVEKRMRINERRT